uniref:PTS transporter subunit IIC n=1 Tax=Cytobacillus oceanisediminis TaxID=665099 RepID=UPI0037BFB9E4
MGLYWTIEPGLTEWFMRKISGNENMGVGDTCGCVGVVGGVVGKIGGKKEKD